MFGPCAGFGALALYTKLSPRARKECAAGLPKGAIARVRWAGTPSEDVVSALGRLDSGRILRAPHGAPLRFAVLTCAIALWSCSGGSGNRSNQQASQESNSPDPPISIVTTALPNGQVGRAYSATLAAKGGAAPLTWRLTAGGLPAGLKLTPSGLISGTPTGTAGATPLTFTVSSAAGVKKQTPRLTLNVSPANISLSVAPARAGLTVTQQVTLTATTNDYGGVNWSISPAGGSFSAASSMSGTAVTFTAPPMAGVYTITATSATDSKQQVAVTVGVTDLAGVYTYHYDLGRGGANTQEYALTPANVNTSTFAKLFSCAVDGAVYAQPLWVANLTVSGSRHNVVLVATAHDSLYAFDADRSPCVQLWQVSLIDARHGGTAGEATVPSGTTEYYVGKGFGSNAPEVGVMSTPVIDPMSGTLYVVSKSMSSGMPPATTSYHQRLHAIDVTTGNEKTGSPAIIAATFPGTSDGGTSVTFSARQQKQTAALALVNGTIYVAWSSHDDAPPWSGWIMGYTYNGTGFTQTAVLDTTPDSARGGVWMSGGAPPADLSGNLYVTTGNGRFDVTSSTPPNHDYGDCFLQLNGHLRITSWFAPSVTPTDNNNDWDFGSGGAVLVLNLTNGPLQHLVVAGGKHGTLYLLNGDSAGGLGDSNAWQNFSVGGGIFSTAVFWNNALYLSPVDSPMRAYAFDSMTNMFNATPTSVSPDSYGFPGAPAAVSASGANTDGIVWALDETNNCMQSASCGPAVLHAYDATNLANELWNSSTVSADAAANAVKFTVPIVANGKVYVGTRGNNTGGVYGSTSISGELDVYGLKPE